MGRTTTGWVAAYLALAATGALAQAGSADDAARRQLQEQRRAEERERAQRAVIERPRTPPRAEPRAIAAWPEGETPCATVHEIALAGPDAAHFAWLVDALKGGAASPLGRCLGAAGLNVALDHAQGLLLDRGWVTSRVLLQPQALADGRLTLTLLAGRVHAIRFADPADPRAPALTALPLRPGDLLNLRDIEQALENLKRVPTVEADIVIEPADAPDQSNLVIAWRQGFPFRVSFSADDSGSRATGRYQGSATLSYDHALTLNDLFYVTVSRDLGGGAAGDRGTRGSTVHYSLPWGDALLAFTASSSRYRQQVAGLDQDNVYHGTSENAEVRLSHLLYRDATHKTTASLKGWMRRANNFIDDTELMPQRRATGGWELGLAHRAFVGEGSLDTQFAHRRGTAAFGAIAASESPGEGTARMRVTTLDLNLNVPFALGGGRFAYVGQWRGQWNGTPLSPPDRLAIGGRYTVRGFDGESSLAAERGWLVRNEIGWTLGGTGHQAYLGLDYGQVRGPSSDALVGKHLAGAVLGLRGNVARLGYDVFVARPVSRPTYFRTSPLTAGFSLNASF